MGIGLSIRTDTIDVLNVGQEEVQLRPITATIVGQEWKENKMSRDAWELFCLITSAYYGKMMYAQQDHGLVYSRYSGKYMTMDDAVREFVRMISWEGEEG